MDVRSYLQSTRFTVVVAAIVVAIPANYLIFEFTGNESLAFLGMFTLGVSVPQLYSRSWPEAYDRVRGLAWTIVACAAALVVLLAAFAVASLALGDLGAAIAAFLAVQLALSAVSYTIEDDDSLADAIGGSEESDDAV